jgi:hypothetical protein
MIDESKSSLLLFDIVSTDFYPWKDIVEKKVSKLRSIAKLRVFYGMLIFKFSTKVEQTWKQHPLRSQMLPNTTLNLPIRALLFQNVDKKKLFCWYRN